MTIVGYEYRIDGGPAVFDMGLPDPLTFTVDGLEEATEYDFEVRGYDAEGNRTPWSNIATASTLGTLQTIPSLWAYYESDSYVGLSDGDTITDPWEDLSGNGFDGTPVTTPTFQTGEINGLPCLRLNSPDDGIDDIQLPSMGDLTGLSWYIVWKVINPPEAGGPILGQASGPGAEVTYAGSLGADTYQVDFGSTAFKSFTDATVDVTDWHCCHGHSKPSDWAFYQNGNLIHSTATNTVGLPASPRLGHNNVVTDRFRVDYAGVYLFSDKLTPEQQTIVEEYITDKWGIAFA